MSTLFLSPTNVPPEETEWFSVICATEGCDNEAVALREVANHGQLEMFPEAEPVHCDGCMDVMAQEYEDEFGWMRSF